MLKLFSLKVKNFSQDSVEDAGVDPATSRMRSARSTIWANPRMTAKFTVKCNKTSDEYVKKFSYYFFLGLVVSVKGTF